MSEGMIQGQRRISGPTETADGFPLPLSGRPLTKTPEQIVTRQAETNLLHWTPPPPPDAPRGTLGAGSEAKIPQWLVDSVIEPAE